MTNYRMYKNLQPGFKIFLRFLLFAKYNSINNCFFFVDIKQNTDLEEYVP